IVPYAAAGPLSGSVPPTRMVSLVTPTSLAVSAAAVVGAGAAGGAVGLAAGALVGAAAGALVGAGGAGAPLEQATSARPVVAKKTMRIADLTVVDSFRGWRFIQGSAWLALQPSFWPFVEKGVAARRGGRRRSALPRRHLARLPTRSAA